MGFGGSDIFQAQMMDLMASLEYVRAYIDDLLIITRGTLDDHLFTIETMLTMMHDAGLKKSMPQGHPSVPMKLNISVTTDQRGNQNPSQKRCR